MVTYDNFLGCSKQTQGNIKVSYNGNIQKNYSHFCDILFNHFDYIHGSFQVRADTVIRLNPIREVT